MDSWPVNESTLDGSWTLVADNSMGSPQISQRSMMSPTPRRRSHRRFESMRQAFSCDVPEDPLRTAMALGSALVPSNSYARSFGSEGNEPVARSLLDFSHQPVGSIHTHRSTSFCDNNHPKTHRPKSILRLVPSTEGDKIRVTTYFPHAEQPFGQFLVLSLPINATVENAIALALWTYWEKCWLPALDASNPRDIDIDSWIVLVPGSDGKVNKRIGQAKIKRFSADKYAIVRSPRTYNEKRQIEKQVANWGLPPRQAEPQKRHHLRHSLPVHAFHKNGRDFTKLPSKLTTVVSRTEHY
ncbi:hypothetical protein FB45DRAFT_897977 [Roridomyces roridus]|uniref:CRIM domain-containing protein n=1 Tax=Roridomyces roridus TaxID=1738132 RepID=A0AAD7CBT4_9AGAR|nr:hypothetical protein FB45DRAFT_897977 [Roridomyces roridus]